MCENGQVCVVWMCVSVGRSVLWAGVQVELCRQKNMCVFAVRFEL